MKAANINHVHGDPYGGTDISQHFIWWPFAGRPEHQTPVAGLYQIRASTYPGHGLGGGPDTLVAKLLLEQAPAEHPAQVLGNSPDQKIAPPPDAVRLFERLFWK